MLLNRKCVRGNIYQKGYTSFNIPEKIDYVEHVVLKSTRKLKPSEADKWVAFASDC